MLVFLFSEWYSYHFPEMVKIVPENYTYARLAKLIGNRKELTEAKLPEIEEIVMDSAKAQAVIDASKSSMGMDINQVDLLNIEMFASRVISLADYRKQLATYLHTKMNDVAPNLSTLIGDQVGARLIAHAGSLTNLAKYPASTIQILGAEKALFRALKTRGNTPKYGLLYHSTFIGRAGSKNKGRISRYLANKCSIASRIDCFTELPSHIFGDKLRQQVEDRLKFYETGEVPRTNEDVMKEAIEETEQFLKSHEKKAKKKKRKSESNGTEDAAMEVVDDGAEKKKKKKKKKDEAENGNEDEDASEIASKKRKLDDADESMNGVDGSAKKKKKKNKKKDQE